MTKVPGTPAIFVEQYRYRSGCSRTTPHRKMMTPFTMTPLLVDLARFECHGVQLTAPHADTRGASAPNSKYRFTASDYHTSRRKKKAAFPNRRLMASRAKPTQKTGCPLFNPKAPEKVVLLGRGFGKVLLVGHGSADRSWRLHGPTNRHHRPGVENVKTKQCGHTSCG